MKPSVFWLIEGIQAADIDSSVAAPSGDLKENTFDAFWPLYGNNDNSETRQQTAHMNAFNWHLIGLSDIVTITLWQNHPKYGLVTIFQMSQMSD